MRVRVYRLASVSEWAVAEVELEPEIGHCYYSLFQLAPFTSDTQGFQPVTTPSIQHNQLAWISFKEVDCQVTRSRHRSSSVVHSHNLN